MTAPILNFAFDLVSAVFTTVGYIAYDAANVLIQNPFSSKAPSRSASIINLIVNQVLMALKGQIITDEKTLKEQILRKIPPLDGAEDIAFSIDQVRKVENQVGKYQLTLTQTVQALFRVYFKSQVGELSDVSVALDIPLITYSSEYKLHGCVVSSMSGSESEFIEQIADACRKIFLKKYGHIISPQNEQLNKQLDLRKVELEYFFAHSDENNVDFDVEISYSEVEDGVTTLYACKVPFNLLFSKGEKYNGVLKIASWQSQKRQHGKVF